MISLLLALACADPSEETDVPEDTDVDTDTDTDTDTEAVDPDHIEVEVRAGVSGQAGWRVAAVLGTLDDGNVVAEREIVSVDASSLPVTVGLDPAEAEDIGPLNETTTGALFFWVLYDDADGDGARGADEPVLAATDEVLGWIEAGDTFDRIWVGLRIDLVGDASPGIFDAFDGFDLTVFPHRTELTVGGTSNLAATPDRMALISVAEIEGGAPLPNRPYDAAWTGSPWSITVSGPLDAARWYDTDLGAKIGLELPVAVADTDADGASGPDDEALGVACWSGRPAGLLYAPEPVTLVGGLTLLATGFDAGWNLVSIGEPDEIPDRIPESESAALVLDGCGG